MYMCIRVYIEREEDSHLSNAIFMIANCIDTNSIYSKVRSKRNSIDTNKIYSCAVTSHRHQIS